MYRVWVAAGLKKKTWMNKYLYKNNEQHQRFERSITPDKINTRSYTLVPTHSYGTYDIVMTTMNKHIAWVIRRNQNTCYALRNANATVSTQPGHAYLVLPQCSSTEKPPAVLSGVQLPFQYQPPSLARTAKNNDRNTQSRITTGTNNGIVPGATKIICSRIIKNQKIKSSGCLSLFALDAGVTQTLSGA